jgi:hypothetical protein
MNRYVMRQTIRKWQDRDSPVDGPHCPKTLNTPLTAEQMRIVALAAQNVAVAD